MRKILKATWVAVCFIVAIAYVVSCFSFCIPSASFSFISIFALLFPYLFVSLIICCISLVFIRRQFAVIFLLIAFLAGFKNLGNTVAVNKSTWNMQKKNGSLRIMTWNVEAFGQQFQTPGTRILILKAIETYNPDIVCIQEYHNVENSVRVTPVEKQLTGMGFSFSYCSNDSTAIYGHTIVHSGVAIFSRIPLLDSTRTDIKSPARSESAISADIFFNNKRVRIFTAHLASLMLYTDTAGQKNAKNIYEVTYKRKRQVEYKIRETEIAHEKEVTIIRDLIDKSPYPVIYCGDINATPASYTYNKLRGNLQDAFLEKGFGIGATFYKLFYTLRIDVCLADKKLQTEQCIVPQLYLSDHFPVVSDLTWK